MGGTLVNQLMINPQGKVVMGRRADMDVLPVFIGYDSREPEAYEVAKISLMRHSSMPLHIQMLDERALRHAGLYRRKWHTAGAQKVDDIDGKPFSTEFSFTRFLVPALCQWKGFALFVDSDWLFRHDIAELVRNLDADMAVSVCKQNYVPHSDTKMDGQVQQKYFRKNWSSFMVFNCEHPSNRMLTVDAVNQEPGSWLHGFGWVPDNEIGDIDHGWNWIAGTTAIEPLGVHMTTGGPWFPHLRHEKQPYFDEWRAVARSIGVWRKLEAQDERQ